MIAVHKEFKVIFSWHPNDMPNMNTNIIFTSSKSTPQKRRALVEDNSLLVMKEVGDYSRWASSRK